MKDKSNVVTLKSESTASRIFDVCKWLLAIGLLCAAFVVNYTTMQYGALLRSAAWIAIVFLAFVVAATTVKGRLMLVFLNDAKSELRKVVWPTKDETMQTTLVVAVMVIVLALILWGVDGVLVWLIGTITGQRA